LDSVCHIHLISCVLLLLSFVQRHTFKRPTRPLEPPTPRTSILGLDKLALEKRTAQAQENGNENGRKRPRTERDNDPVFKGECHSKLYWCLANNKYTVPSLPASRSTVRQRGEETPSNPGGISESARRRLEEHRKNRERQRGEFFLSSDKCSLSLCRGYNGGQ
jgi:pre-mRNA-splicing factor ATP-dependent RNA helicase DHX38/PRP16